MNIKTAFTCCSLIVLAIYFGSCGKTTPGYTVCTDDKNRDTAAMLQFAQTNGIHPVRDTSGLYYQIIDTGAGVYPNANSILYVRYVGKFLSGNTFDSLGDASKSGFQLDKVISAWQIGIPKIKSGGHIKMISPSSLAYSCYGSNGVIPAFTPLYFDVYLDSLK